jgi:hypothetical protein
MTGLRAYWVSFALFVSAIVWALDPLPYVPPDFGSTPIPEWATDPSPVRQTGLSPRYVVAGFTYRCSDCHNVLPSPAETERVLTQHTEIELEHGLNTRCFNCHHPKKRDSYVDDFGREIPWNQPQLLCAKCHGPVYRDWQHGAHGRSNGYWDQTRGEQTRRRCIECHDPHTPPFPAMKPAPGPYSPTVGHSHPAADAEVRDPLRIHHNDPPAGTQGN